MKTVILSLISCLLIFACQIETRAQVINDTNIYLVGGEDLTEPNFIYQQDSSLSDKLTAFYKEHLIYPESDQCCEGKVFISFIVEKDSTLSNIQIKQGIPGCPDFDKEALRLIGLMDNLWQPALKKGEAVRFKMLIPVNFKIFR